MFACSPCALLWFPSATRDSWLNEDATKHLHGIQMEGMTFYYDVILNSGSCPYYPQFKDGKTNNSEGIFFFGVMDLADKCVCCSRVGVILLLAPPAEM